MMELASWRSIGSSTMNAVAIGSAEHGKSNIFIWGSNTNCLIPYLPDNLELDIPQELQLEKLFTKDLALPKNYHIKDIQVTETLCYFLIEEYLPTNLFDDLKKKRKQLEAISPAVETDDLGGLLYEAAHREGRPGELLFLFLARPQRYSRSTSLGL